MTHPAKNVLALKLILRAYKEMNLSKASILKLSTKSVHLLNDEFAIQAAFQTTDEKSQVEITKGKYWV